jgi:hypothetical protein
MLKRALAAPSQGLLGWGRRLAPGQQQTRAFVKYVGFRRAAPTTWKSRLAYTVLRKFRGGRARRHVQHC